MKNTFALPALLVLGIAIWACNKEDPDDDPATPSPTPDGHVLDGVFASNIEDETQTFAVSNEWGGQYVAEHGTELYFSPGAFLHTDGSPVNGAVEVSVVEVLTVGRMIWLNKQTVGNDNGTLRTLRSGGAINVFASQGGEMLQITESGLIAKIPTEIGDPAMQLFTGAEDSEGRMIWTVTDSASVTVEPGYVTPTYTFPYYFSYGLSADSLNWINCDYFYNYPSITPLEAVIPPGQSTDSTLVWIAFPGENAVASLHNYTGQVFQTSGGYEVPVGMSAVIVGLQQTATGYASSFTPITITTNMSVPMTFSPTTLPQFEAALDGL